MTYSQPYANYILKKHPHGDKFKRIQHLADQVGTYIAESPDPEEEEKTRAQRV